MSETYYVRSRGKITGPFDVPALQKLAKRGLLTRVHQVSTDKQSWVNAEEYQELFPNRAGPAADEQAAQPADAATAVAPKSDSYFYAQHGATVGPVSLSALRTMAQNGSLGAEDLCWTEGSDTANFAAHLPALAPFYSLSGSSARGNGIGLDLSAQRRLLTRTNGICLVASIVAGCILLLCLNLPLYVDRDRTVWWWDVVARANSDTASIFFFFVLCAGITVAIVGGAARGLARAWTLITVGGLSYVLMLTTSLYQNAQDASVVCALAAPYLLCALLGASRFRYYIPRMAAGSVCQGIFGGLLLFATIVSVIIALANRSRMDLPFEFRRSELPGWLTISLAMGLTSLIASLAAGVIGLVGLRSTYVRGLNTATVVCAAGSILLSTLAVIIIAFGVVDVLKMSNAGFAVFGIIRICAVCLAFMALVETGVFELLVSSAVDVKPTRHGFPIARN